MVDRRLGRGLDFFLSGGRSAQPAATPTIGVVQAAGNPDLEELVVVEVEKLMPSPYQPRKNVAESDLQTLADSIKASGILQPILVRRKGDGFEIVAGERRWRAAQLAGLKQVPVMVRPITDQDCAVFGLVENLQREDLNAIEKAHGFKLLLTKLATTQEEVAHRVGFDRSSVANYLRLLELPEEVQAHVSRGTLTMGHARSLLALGSAEAMVQCADDAIRQAMSVRMLEAKVKGILEASRGDRSHPPSTQSTKSRPVWLNELEESLVEAIGAPVSIRYGRKRSQIIIECAGREEFERVYQRIKNA